jgi:hypothetical protein
VADLTTIQYTATVGLQMAWKILKHSISAAYKDFSEMIYKNEIC